MFEPDIHHTVQESTWTFAVRDGDGRIVRRQARRNILTEAGLAEMCRRNVGASDTSNTHHAVGTGDQSEALSDTALQNERHRKAVGTRAAVAATERYTTDFAANELGALPVDITEAGLFTAAAGGTCVYRVTCDPMTITAGRTLTITAVITHKNGALL